MASRKTSNQQRKRPECHTPDLTITPRNDIHKGFNIHLFFVAKNDDIPNLIQAKWSHLTSGHGAWPYRDNQKNRRSNQSIIDIATALYFVAPIIKPC